MMKEVEVKKVYERYQELENMLEKIREDLKELKKLPKKLEEMEKNIDRLYDFSKSKEWEKYGKFLSDYGHEKGYHLDIFDEDSIFEVVKEFDKIKKKIK